MFKGFRSRERIVGPDELDGDQTKAEEHGILSKFGPLGRVKIYVLLV
jgi:hypothetical protein